MMDSSADSNKIKEGFIGQRMIVLPPDIRGKLEKNNLVKYLHVTAIGFYPHATYHDRQRKWGCDEYILLYCTEGEGDINIENKKLHLTPNHYVIIPPSKPHHYRSSTENPWSIYWVHFSGAHADFLFARYLDRDQPKIKSIPYDQIWIDEFMQIIDLLEDSFSEKSLEISNVNALYLITSLIYHLEIHFNDYENDTIDNSISFMKNQLHENLKVGELAKLQNLSVSRYSELFKEKTGFSPIKFFINLKIQKSCQYLYFTDMNISEICKKIGFEDPYYFSRIFKKHMGMAPSKYRMVYKKNFLEK